MQPLPPAVPAVKPAVAQAVPEKESAAEPVREKKSFKISVPSAVWKISGITIAVVISCALLFAAALIGLGKMKKLPKPLEPLATKLFGKIITREAPAEKSDSKPAVLEPAVPVSQVRSEYRAALDEVAGQNNSPESFDAVWELLSEPQNEEERALFREAFPRFVTADESRCDDARDVARSRFLQAKEKLEAEYKPEEDDDDDDDDDGDELTDFSDDLEA